jgi:exonuclease III
MNVAGISYYKLFLLLEQYHFDILCLQETWLAKEAIKPNIPGFNLIEERRDKGHRGGIAVYVRTQLHIEVTKANEYAIYTRIMLPDSMRFNLVTTYIPPATSLVRR